MMNYRFTFQKRDSFIHSLHPVIKLLILIELTILLFVLEDIVSMILLFLLVRTFFIIMRISPLQVRGFPTIMLTSLFIALVHLLSNRNGQEIFIVFQYPITINGLMNGLRFSLRFLGVILVSLVFVLSTNPNDLVLSLMKSGLPYRIGFVLITALRLVPIFSYEAETIYTAQKMRGLHYSVKSISRSFYALKAFLFALVVSLLKKVDGLSVSMEGRSFGRYRTRTFLQEIQLKKRDLFVLLIVIVPSLFYLGMNTGVW